MFLVRPRPLPGESLTSWRQRSGLENGFRLFPRAPGELQRTDSDLKPAATTVGWLAQENLLTEGEVMQMTLAGLDGTLLRFRGGASVPRWVLPLRYSRRDRPFGIPFCPQCLREDEVPHFRLRWRLCLHSVCERHGIRLIDGCNRCGHPSWPATSALGNVYEGAWIPVHECPVCRYDLRFSPSVTDTSELLPVSGQFFERDVSLSNGAIVPAVEFASAAWCVAQLFIRNRSARKIHAAVPAAREVIEEASRSDQRSIEWLPLEMRLRLTSQVAGLFQGWPETLLTFGGRCGLSAEHFSVDRQELPHWFEAAIRSQLRKQIRDVSHIEVQSAMDQLTASGIVLTKQAVSKLLGSSGGKSLQEVLGRRMRASSAELQQMLTALADAASADQKRRSSTEVLVRDAVAILLAVTLEKQLDVVVEMSLDEALRAISAGRDCVANEHDLERAYALLAWLSAQYIQHRADLGRKRKPAADLFFVCFRGGRVQSRGAKRLLQQCMQNMDARLARSISVFWQGQRIDERGGNGATNERQMASTHVREGR